MSKTCVRIQPGNERPCRLVPAEQGAHQFGGVCNFSGLTPAGSEVLVQQLLLLDLSDPDMPFTCDPPINSLPLLYPFKYGFGGPEMQYSVVSDTEVEILYLSDPEPDDPEGQYLQVETLPVQPLELRALTYEEARLLAFQREDGYFQSNSADRSLLKELDTKNLIALGGRRNYIENAPDIICRNPRCDCNGRRTHFHFLASVPPIPVQNQDEFWYEFQGAYVDFCFVLCSRCGTVITFNVAD